MSYRWLSPKDSEQLDKAIAKLILILPEIAFLFGFMFGRLIK